MADLQISQLPALAEADLAAGDELAVVDDSASETKRITAKALVEKGVALIDAGSIPGSALASLGTDTVITTSIAANAVTSAKIATGAVGASEIADGSITATEIAANTLTANQIAANAIGASELADDAVDTAAIANGAVTSAKLAVGAIAFSNITVADGDIAGAKISANSLTATQIAANAIGSSELADDAVDTNAIVNGAVTGGKIGNTTITASNIVNNTITASQIANDTITATQIASNAIGASELGDNAVDTNSILDDAVTAAKLAAGAVDTTALGAGAVTGAKIASTTITAANIAAGTITATELAANSVGASEIQANAVGASELADDAVDTDAIANLAVTNAKIADATITYAKLNLADGSIPSAKIASGAIGNAQIAANAVGATELANNAVDTDAIQNLAVTNAKIAAATITGAKIAATTITAGNIVANTLTANQIASNAIGASELADDAVDTNAILDNAVTGAKIANTTITAAKLNLSDGDIAGAKITSNSITATQIAADAVGASELANNAVDTNALADDAVTGAKIAAATITGANIATGTITATQLAADSVGASEIAANAVGASELADDAVDTAAIANLAVTGAKIANATITGAKLSLSAGDIDGTKIAADSLTASQIAANAITASELADDAVDTAAIANNAVTTSKIAANAVTASELADNAVDTAAVADAAITTAKIADGAVTAAKLDGTLPAGSIASNAVTTVKIADDAVTAAKIGAGAVDTLALGATSVTTAKVAAGAITDAKIASGISGAKLTDGTVTAAKLLTSDIDRSLNVAAGKLGINNTISAGTSVGISYNAQGLITAVTALAASDLPVSTATAVGGVSVPTAGGLTVTGAGALSIAATTTGATATKVTFNNFGQITGTAVLAAADLPKATASAVGAVSVPTGGPLSIDSNGAITVADSGVTAGVGTKVTVDAKGRVTNLSNLTSSDLPNHSAALITSGSIPTARIANDAITGSKLANASTTLFGSVAQTGFPTSQFTGQFFFDSVSEDLYIYDGNAYQPVTTLTKGSLVFGGTFNASTSKVASVTTAGAAAGLSVGSNVPTPTSSTDGLYLVVEASGTPSAPAPVVALAPPDYILGVTNTSGSSWEEIDLSQTVAGQVASNISFTPFGQLQSTNVQDALEELETEKLAKAGGTVTGQVLFGNTATLVFEGSSTDAFQTTLGVVNPTTSDKTILLPNTSGTLITNNDSGTVTSAMLADGTIVNADINASAAIALTKLEGIAAGKIIVGNGSGVAAEVAVTGDISISDSGVVGITANSIVDADISNSAAIAASKIVAASTSGAGVVQLNDTATSTSTSQAATANALKAVKDALDSTTATAVGALATTGGTLTGDLLIDNAKALKFGEADADGAHFTSIKAQAQTGDIELVLPASAPSAGQVLKASSSSPTTLEWATDVTNTAAGDLTGTTLASNVVASSLTSVGTLTSLNVSGTITGDVTGDLTGNADTATRLATARSIGGVSFNGTADITLPGVNAAGNQNTTGNAATATKFASAVTIGGVSFDGSANINLPGVNAAGTQDTSGTAALATQFTVTANNATNETVFPLFVDAATGSQGAETDTGFTYNPSTGALTSTSFVGALTGNASTATALATARAINGVDFDGTADITVTAAAGTLSGNTLASGVTASSLTSVGTLTGLTSSGDINLNAQADLRFKDADSSHYVALQSPSSLASSFTLTLPSTDAAVSGYVLASDGAGTLSWVDPGSTSSPTFTGDVSLTNDGNLVGFAALSATYTGNPKTLTVTVASKTGAHRYNGSGSGSGYKIDGKEAPFLTLTPGRTYKFDQSDSSNSGHPLRFYLDVDKNTAYTTGVTTSGSAGSAGAYTQIVVSDTTPQVLHYQCSAHGKMGNSVQTNSNQADLSALNASNLSSGTVNVARLGSGSSVTTKFLRGDNTWQTISATPEGTAILSTGESGGTKFLREDGDGTCSWQDVPAGVTINNQADNRIITATGTTNTLNGEASLTFDGTNLDLGDDKKIRLGDSAELSLYTRGSDSNSVIEESGSGVLFVSAPFVRITDSGLSTSAALFQTAGSCELSYAGTKKIETTSSGVAVTGGLTVSGDLTVNGTTTTIDTTTLQVEDKNIEIGKVSSPSDTTADGGGLTLKGATDKTFNWVNSTDAWTSSEHIQVASGKTFIGNGSTLTALNADNIASGTVSTARLGSGTASSSNFLRGDGSWATPSTSDSSKMPLTGGEFTGDVTFTGDSYSVLWDKTDNSFEFGDNAKAVFGSDADMSIKHSGSHGTIDCQTGDLRFKAAQIEYQGATSGTIAELNEGGACVFYHNNSLKLSTSSTGISVTGGATFSGDVQFGDNDKAVFGNSSDLQIHHNSSTGADIINSASYLQLQVSGTEYLRVNSNGATITGTCTAGTFSGSGASLTNLPAPTPAGSNKQIQFNNSNSLGADANLTFDTSTSTLNTPKITLSDSLKTSSRVKVQTGATAQYETIDFDTTGETSFKYQNSTRLQLISSGVRFYGDEVEINSDLELKGANYSAVWDKSDNALEFGDNAKIKIGSNSDLNIFHDGNSYIDNAVANQLAIQSDDLKLRSHTDSENYLTATANGAVELFFNGNKKFNTTADGGTLTGNLFVSEALQLNDSKKIELGNSQDLKLYHDGTTNIIEGLNNNLSIRPKTGENGILISPDGAVNLYYDDSIRLATTSSGVAVTGTVSDSKGNLRSIPKTNKSATYAIVAADAGTCLATNSQITVQGSQMSTGDAVTILNNSGSSINIVRSSISLYNTGNGNDEDTSLGARGIATIYFLDAANAYISGSSLGS